MHADGTAWLLYRLDDNNNRFEIARFASEREAQAACEVYEARGHKQTYWIEPTQEKGATGAPPSDHR